MNSDLNKNKENENNIDEKFINENLELKKEDNKQNLKTTIFNNIKIDNNNKENIIEEQKSDIPNKNFLNDYYKNEDLKTKDKKLKDGKEILDLSELLGNKEEEIPITLDILDESFENFPNSKVSSRNFGIIKAYGVNTSQGIVRDYNEDRVSIVINMVKPPNCNISDLDWPKISYFAIFDGHAGNKCADYLKDNLIKQISNNIFFPKDMKSAIKLGFLSAEKDFLENYAVKNNKVIDKSGSCALILLTVNNTAYIANVGDSRCVISCKKGKILKDATRDHKPNYPYEKERIIKNKGNIYQSETPIDLDMNDEEYKFFLDKVILGPYRVSPGRLSVSRTIGDAEAKIPQFGGNPNVIICEPDIYTFDLNKDDLDFFILGCDGIYDQLSSKEVLDCAWKVFNDLSNRFNDDLNENCGKIIDMILKMSMIRKSYDNVTCLIVAFKEMNEFRSKSRKEKYQIHHKEIQALFNKISNKKINSKYNENQEKSMILHKNKLPLLHLNANPINYNKIGIKKIFKDKNNFINYINKININSNKAKKKQDSLTIRNLSVPRKQNKLILKKNNITINNEIFKDKVNSDYSQNVINTNNKKIYDIPKFSKLTNFTEPNINNKYKNRIENPNTILTNSAKSNKLKSLNLKKISSNHFNDEENNNSISSIQTKRLRLNQMIPLSNNSIDDKKYFNYFSVNKKNSVLIDINHINSQKELDSKKNMNNIRLKSVENKLPLYQKAFKKSNISNRNNNENSLNNNKLNILTYDKIPNNIITDKKKIILNDIKNYPSNDDINYNNIKIEKPIKLKIGLLNSNQIKNQSNLISKNNSLENNNKMPYINQQRNIITYNN